VSDRTKREDNFGAGDEEQRIFTDFHYKIKVLVNGIENVKAIAVLTAAAVFGNRQNSPAQR